MKKELEQILNLHKMWVEGNEDGVRANLNGANLNGANLSGVNLYHANLRDADLYHANLSGADLRGVDLYRADLRGVDLYLANLSGADLRGADLSGANLNGANLYRADLSEANLSRANLNGAVNCYIFNAYDTSKRIVYCVRHKENWMVQAGCFWGNLDELENKVLDTHRSKVYLANIALLKELSNKALMSKE